MNKLYPHDKKECLLVDYKHFHKQGTNFSNNQNTPCHINFHGFQGLGYSIFRGTTKVSVFPEFQRFFQGDEKNQECFKGFKEFKGRWSPWYNIHKGMS